MATIAEAPLLWAQQQIIKAYRSAVNSGNVPDEAHKKSGGYHVSENDLYLGFNDRDYSNVRVGDREVDLTPRGQNACCADDISMSTADMILHHNRVRAVYNNQNDPRRPFLNYINTYDGTGDAVRYDFVGNRILFADATHKWHRHADTKRVFQDVGNPTREAVAWKCARARVSVETGQSIAAWLAQEEGEVAIEPADVLQIWQTPIAAEYVDENNSGVREKRSPLDMLHATHANTVQNEVESKVRFEALMAAVAGEDNDEILARVDTKTDELKAEIANTPARTVELLGSLDAAALEDLLREGASPEVLAELAVRLSQPAV